MCMLGKINYEKENVQLMLSFGLKTNTICRFHQQGMFLYIFFQSRPGICYFTLSHNLEIPPEQVMFYIFFSIMTIAIVYFTLHVYLCVSISISKFIHMYIRTAVIILNYLIRTSQKVIVLNLIF